MSALEPEPDLGPAAETLENGAEPDDALYIDRGWVPDPPEVADELDTAHGAAALAEAREPEPAGPASLPVPETAEEARRP